VQMKWFCGCHHKMVDFYFGRKSTNSKTGQRLLPLRKVLSEGYVGSWCFL